MSSIKTNFEMPRGDDPVKQAQRLSQDLSSNFKAVSKQITNIQNTINNAISSQFIDFPFTIAHNTSVTLTHNFNVIPTGWYIIDKNDSGTGGGNIYRTSWSTTNIVLTNFNVLGFASVYYNIRVFI